MGARFSRSHDNDRDASRSSGVFVPRNLVFRRSIAVAVDALVMGLTVYLVAFVVDLVLATANGSRVHVSETTYTGDVVGLLAASAYLICLEASRWHATLGKKLLRLVVVFEARGQPRAINLALARTITKVGLAYVFVVGGLLFPPLGVALIIPFILRDGRHLHDVVARTRVVLREDVPRPPRLGSVV